MTFLSGVQYNNAGTIIYQWREEFPIKKMTPVRVHLTSTIQQDGQSERFDFAEKGTFVEQNGKY